ncbi:MAG: hypothetical protein Q8934_22970 [Bacillota bacterium]|nr:hypothetical protein [Bacillota bacterium]
MIKTKLFEGFIEDTGKTQIKYGNEVQIKRFVSVDEEINRFLQENSHIEVIDIKFSVGGSHEDILPMALMIYKELVK